MFDAIFAGPDLTAFCRLDELGLQVVGQRLEAHRAVLACRVAEPDSWCRRCGCEGAARDTVTRRLAHEPLGWRPTTLLVTLRRYRCTGCGHVWRKTSARPPSHGRGFRAAGCGGRWKASCVSTRIAEGLGVSWSTANSAVLDEGKSVLINDSGRFEGVKVIGVDEHAWRHTRRGDKFVTVIIDLTPVGEGVGPARLLDMVQGRSKRVFKTWLEAQSAAFRGQDRGGRDGRVHRVQDRHQRTTARRGRGDGPLPRPRPGRRRCRRQRVQQDTCGHRGRSGDPLYRIRRALRTGADLLTEH